MTLVARAYALFAAILGSETALSCSVPFANWLETDLQSVLDRSTTVVAGHATSIAEDSESVIARLEIDAVFKGQAPRVLVFRALHTAHPCDEIKPPETEPFFAFMRFDRGNIQAPDWISFVRQSALPIDFAGKLGTPAPPSADSKPLLRRLAPPNVQAASINRTEGEILSESWPVSFDEKLWRWDRQPRFYLRYPKATFLLDPPYVIEKVEAWNSKELLEALRRSLPLTESTDLYMYQLNMNLAPNVTELLDQLAIQATIDARVQIIHGRCCLRRVQVNRSSLGTQSVTYYDMELVRSSWQPQSNNRN